MPRFNSVTTTKIINKAGGESFSETPKLALTSLVLTSFVKDQFYRSASVSLQEIKDLVKKIDPLFVAKLALYARKEFGMRSISHVLAGEIALSVKNKEWTKNFFDQIVYRPDDMTEILSYYYATGQKNEPNALKKGFALALARQNEYKLAKYKMADKDVSLIDVVNLCHPKHTPALDKLMKNQLTNTETWEAQLSSGKDKTQVWSALLSENKLGYFALLRNLRNILETAPQLVDLVVSALTNEQVIKKSLVLPFRFLSALEALQEVSLSTLESRKIMMALSKAIDISLSNIPVFEGSTLVVVDVSGSMTSGVDAPIKKASLFAAALYRANMADLMLFDFDAHYANANPTDSTLSIAQAIVQRATGGGTNFNAPFNEANKVYDRIIILSDMQGWIGYNAPTAALAEYRKRTGAAPKIFSFDLTGYGTLEFPEKEIFCLSGFSEKCFDIMKLLEEDKQALITKIEGIPL